MSTNENNFIDVNIYIYILGSQLKDVKYKKKFK